LKPNRRDKMKEPEYIITIKNTIAEVRHDNEKDKMDVMLIQSRIAETYKQLSRLEKILESAEKEIIE